jgi:CelD/BcsL family acetyltransferase involved in cellulose biosynthesis
MDSMLEVSLVDDVRGFEELQSDWEGLAGENIFRSWAWLFSWWQAFAHLGQLNILVCRNRAREIVGIAPWYVTDQFAQGRVIRFLGTGKACSEYLGLLCGNGQEPAVGEAIADWLVNGSSREWDAIELEAVTSDDVSTMCFIDELRQRKARTITQPGMPCWRVELPATWDEFVGRLGGNDRKKTRQGIRELIDSGLATLQVATDQAQLLHSWNEFKNLHERRRAMFDGDHCFLTPGFEAFLISALQRLLEADRLHFATLKIDDRPAALSIGLVAGGTFLMYQCGMEPELRKFSPGWMLNALNIRDCIGKSFHSFDFLRGDESYKSRFKAKPLSTVCYRITAPRAVSRLRGRVWSASNTLRNIGKAIYRSQDGGSSARTDSGAGSHPAVKSK